MNKFFYSLFVFAFVATQCPIRAFASQCDILTFEEQRESGKISWLDYLIPKGIQNFVRTMAGTNPLVNTVGAKQISAISFLTFAFKYWNNPHKALAAIHDSHGDFAYFQLPTGRFILFARNKSMLEKVIRETSLEGARFEKDSLQTSASEKVLGKNNIFTNRGSSWQSLRDVLAPFFRPAALKEQNAPQIISSVFRDHFTEYSQNGGGNFSEFLNQTIFDVVLKAIFKMDISREEVKKTISPAFEKVMNWIVFETALNPTQFHAADLPSVTKTIRESKTSLATVEELAEKVIEVSLKNTSSKKNLVQALADSGLSREDLRNNVMTIVAASFETTSSYIAWASYELAKNPAMQNKIRQDLRAIGPEVLTTPELAPESLRIFLEETLRFYTPFYTFARRTNDAVRINVNGGSIDLPANSSIIFDLQSINRQEAIFGKERTGYPANEFQPMRYHPDVMEQHGLRKIDIDHNAFGNGRRFCLGFVFAQMETTLFATQMLYDYQLNIPKGFEPGMKSGIAIKPELDLPIQFERVP